jgi:hypothetical protein
LAQNHSFFRSFAAQTFPAPFRLTKLLKDWGKERNKGGVVWESFLKENAKKTVNIFAVQAS